MNNNELIEKRRDELAHILNALPDIDPHDDESWMVDKCLERYMEAITATEQRVREEMFQAFDKVEKDYALTPSSVKQRLFLNRNEFKSMILHYLQEPVTEE